MAAALRGLGSLLGMLIMLVGLPVALVVLVGWPLPSWDEVVRYLNDSSASATLTMGGFFRLVACVLWLVWAAMVILFIAEIVAAVGRIRLPRPRLAVPAQQAATALLGGLMLAIATIRAAAAPAAGGPGAAAPAAGAPQGPAGADGADASPSQAVSPQLPAPPAPPRPAPPMKQVGQITVTVAGQRYTHTVAKGDTLWHIAQAWLGDPHRWPEIYALNRGRHWADVGGSLHDPDLIYPGWVLDLPADARPPAGTVAERAASEAGVQPQPGPPDPEGAGAPSPSASTTAADPDGGVAEVHPPTVTGSPVVGSPYGSHTTPTGADRSAGEDARGQHPRGGDRASAPTTDLGGVHLPSGSYVPWSLAAAIAAAAAAVWLQRRRRFTPGVDPPGGELEPLPPVVERLRRDAVRNPDLALPAGPAERAAAVPDLPPPPAGGLGLVGDGAHAAARAAVVTALASGGPAEPAHRGEVVIDVANLILLFGAEVAGQGGWGRLHVADDAAHAMTILDARMLQRARVLDEHSLTDLGSMRRYAPDEEATPPLLLVCQPPEPGALMRARALLNLGVDLGTSALLLGPWPYGCTVEVNGDGRTRVLDGRPPTPLPARLGVLETADAAAMLATLREAHTGRPPSPAEATPTPIDTPHPAGKPDTVRGESQPPGDSGDLGADTGAEQEQRARLRTLGEPRVEDLVLPGRPLRGKAAELAVFLACHPDGADTATIAEHLFPEAKVEPSKQQVHTNASNLRHVLGRAAGFRPGRYVLKRGTASRYRLDPTAVEVDLWQLQDLLTRARLASAPGRTDLLRNACEIYTEPLAAGCDYEWIEPHREKARRWGTEVHLLLADDLLDSDPQTVSDLLDKAIGLDRYNEELYRAAMRARHALGDADGIRVLLRALRRALGDLDAEPAEATVEMAALLREGLLRAR